MAHDTLAKRLADRSRVGLDNALADKLRIKTEDAMRGEILGMTEGKRGPLGVYLLAVYVVDDSDLWSDGEIYWWSIPALVRKDNSVSWNAAYGLPAGSPPHSCGSLEWMTNLSMKEPPLLAVIPADDQIASCNIRLGIYDDDGKAADFPRSMAAGYEALALCKQEGLKGADSILGPVREAIWNTLVAKQDDVLIDEDLVIQRAEGAMFGAGFVASVMNKMVRVYYFVKDELHTRTAGPVELAKGQVETIKFEAPVVAGGRVSIFASGGDVACSALGDLTTETPFIGKIVDSGLAKQLEAGISVSAKDNAKVVVFYTPPV